MFAVTQTVTITDRPALHAGLAQVVPHVSGLPGFVAGYWMERPADQGQALVMFDSEEAAKTFADFLQPTPEVPGVHPDRASIEVCAVLSHA